VITHIAKRILVVVLGYFAGLATGAAALPVFLLLISYFNPSSQLWQFLGLGPIAVIVAPVILLTIMWIVMILTSIPAAALNLLTEAFALRQLWLHLLISLLLAAIAGLRLMPDWFSAMTRDRWLLTLAIGLSALIGGIVYWAIAGRKAGFRRAQLSAPPVPS
jgi:hypothetical protein